MRASGQPLVLPQVHEVSDHEVDATREFLVLTETLDPLKVGVHPPLGLLSVQFDPHSGKEIAQTFETLANVLG